MHALTSKTMFDWTPQADSAFLELKNNLIAAPVLILPDASQQFVVEVDASDVGIGAALSQPSPQDGRLHPCAYPSRKLEIDVERKYDVGNRELLAIKAALEKQRHWLEEAEQLFVVWTDHKNLDYLRTAKRVNSLQAKWALFFG